MPRTKKTDKPVEKPADKKQDRATRKPKTTAKREPKAAAEKAVTPKKIRKALPVTPESPAPSPLAEIAPGIKPKTTKTGVKRIAATMPAAKPPGPPPAKTPVQAPLVKSPPAVNVPASATARVETPKTLPVEVESPAVQKPKIKFNETITVKELAEKLNVKTPEVLKKLMSMGLLSTINQRLEPDVVTLVSDAFGADAELVPIFSVESDQTLDEPSTLRPRPPVVTVMGHVDHGKTSLLDAIRTAKVAAGEAGGITQHIGAYQARTSRGIITFLDTPGHEAFTAMRARGTTATDIVVLVVGADDGVMPQTIEAIDHAQAAKVPIVVAINKIDLPTANPQRIKQSLSDHGLAPEEWGGKTIMVEVSAKTKQNLDKLLEMILLEAEILELKANPNRPARATVLEARLDSRRGPVATVLVKTGTLKRGDVFVCGFAFGKVKALIDDRGQRLEAAEPSRPAELLGFSEPPQAGDPLVIVSSEREARDIAERRKQLARESAQKPHQHLSLEHLHEKMRQGRAKELPLILKTDVQGSLQALKDSLERLSTPTIQLKMVHAGVGGINESDVLLAEASDAVILGFNVKTETGAEEEARRNGVEIRTYRIIYEVLSDVKAAMEGLLEPELKEIITGRAQVKQTFKVPKSGMVAGCLVVDGKLSRGNKARVIRDGKVAQEGIISSLKRFKDDVRDVEKGYECGLTIEGCQFFKPGDEIVAFQIEKRAKKLE